MVVTAQNVVSDVKGFHIDCTIAALIGQLSSYDDNACTVGCRDVLSCPNGMLTTIDVRNFIFPSQTFEKIKKVKSNIDSTQELENVDILLGVEMLGTTFLCVTIQDALQVGHLLTV